MKDMFAQSVRETVSRLLYAGVVVFLGSTSAYAWAPGCGPAAVADSSKAGSVARCEPNSPPAQPLAEKTPFSVGLASLSVENSLVLMVGLEKGEFAAENLDLQLNVMPTPDATQLVAQGKLDAGFSAPDASFYNAASQDYNIRWVAGNFAAPEKSGAGLYARKGTSLNDLKGEVIGSIVGPGSTVTLFIHNALLEAGSSLKDVNLQRFETASLITALDNGGAKAVWLTDPAWAKLSKNPDYVQLAHSTPHRPFGGLLFGPNVLGGDKRAAGEAFVRAYIRTINTYFRGDYKSDPAMNAYFANVLKIPVETFQLASASTWDWEIRSGTTQALQEAMHIGKALRYEGILPEEKLIDPSFYASAVGSP